MNRTQREQRAILADVRDELRTRAEAAEQERDKARETITAYEDFTRGVGILVSTSACLKRPEYKYEPWDGPCGQCAPCVATKARETLRSILSDTERQA